MTGDPGSGVPRLPAGGWQARVSRATTRSGGAVLALVPVLVVLVLVTYVFPVRASDERNYVELANNLLGGHYAGLGWRPATPPYGTTADPANPDL